MRIPEEDRHIIAEQLERIARGLERATNSVRATAKSFENNGRGDEITSLLNELLWLLPNLGIQAAISTLVRDLEREASKANSE